MGQHDVRDLFTHLARGFSDCTSHRQEIVTAEVIGDVAYTVVDEHTRASISGEPQEYVLRATQIYRREEWKVVHRHADTVPSAAGS